MTNDDEELTPSELEIEESRIARLVTVEEIFAEGFQRGLASAGLQSRHHKAYLGWLLHRVENRI